MFSSKTIPHLKYPLVTVFICLAILVVFPTSTFNVQAQSEPIALSLTPPITHLIIQPGKTAIHTFTLKNTGTLDVEISTEMKDFTSDQESGIPVLLDEFTFPYLQLPEQSLADSFLLAAGEERQFTIQFEIPESALEKEYHFTLLFSAKVANQHLINDGTTNALTTQIGSNVIATITRTEKDLGNIVVENFKQPRLIDSFMAIEPQIYVKNTGKNMTVTTGKLTIENRLTGQQHEQDILPENVLPNAIRKLQASQAETIDLDIYAKGVPFRYRPLFLFGPYTLTLSYHSPNQTSQLYQISLFAFPFSVLFFIAFVIIGYIMYSIYLRKSLLLTKKSKQT